MALILDLNAALLCLLYLIAVLVNFIVIYYRWCQINVSMTKLRAFSKVGSKV